MSVAGIKAFGAWLAEPVGFDRRTSSSARLYEDYCGWSAAVERAAKKRKLLLRRLGEYPLLPRLVLLALYDRFAAVGFRVEMALERLRRRLPQSRQNDALHQIRQGEVLGQNHFQGVVEVQSGLSCGLQPGEDAESPGRETDPAAERGMDR